MKIFLSNLINNLLTILGVYETCEIVLKRSKIGGYYGQEATTKKSWTATPRKRWSTKNSSAPGKSYSKRQQIICKKIICLLEGNLAWRLPFSDHNSLDINPSVTIY